MGFWGDFALVLIGANWCPEWAKMGRLVFQKPAPEKDSQKSPSPPLFRVAPPNAPPFTCIRARFWPAWGFGRLSRKPYFPRADWG